MNQVTETAATILMAIVGVAILSVLVSRRAQTPQVIQAAGSAFSNALGAAMTPLNDQGFSPNTAYPSSMGLRM